MSKLFEYREQLNLTQDELAETSGISVRTIQRIEAGAKLKGHTLIAIAQALKIDPSKLKDIEKVDVPYNYRLIKLINLSSLLLFIPLGNILIPLLIIYLKKEKNKITEQIISVQILWTIISLVAFLMTPFLQKWFSLSKQLIIVVLMICILSNIFIILRNAMEIDKNKKLRIKLKFSLI
jgi:transcriptional regulator with XRE-family HTH domain